MDVPFLSSGAMSRVHYALVRKVEGATSSSLADQFLLDEVENVRDRLLRSSPTVRQTKECLVMLLYCSMNCTAPLPDLEFALPHALNLAEAGKSVQDKRIGYMYCVEMMPKSHELQLMLVNTLRKDMEALDVGRICLALDVLIQDPSEDVIPAIRDRLHDLLSHNSLHVRRRALLAFRALGAFEADIMKDVVQKMRQRLEDPDPTVASAALTVCLKFLEAGLITVDKLRPILYKLLRDTWHAREDISRHWLLIKILQLLSIVQPSAKAVLLIIDITGASSHHSFANVVLHQCFQVFSNTDVDILQEAQASTGIKLIQCIRHLLVSEDANDRYLFLSCLDNLDAKLWAGTTPEIPAALEEWEVERVMQLLDSPDPSLRKKTLKVLQKVDVEIIEAYFTQLLQASSALPGLREQEEATQRLLEVIRLLYAGTGEAYAQHIKTTIRVVEGAVSSTKPHVVQVAVEDVLTSLRSADAGFRAEFIGVLVAFLDESMSDEKIGPSMTVILSATLCEYLDLSPIPPIRTLQGLARLLPLHGAAIQDAILLAMIRVAASCDDIPGNVSGIVGKIQETAGRHIKGRCEQFMRLSPSKDSLNAILSRAASFSLPDFLAGLEGYEANPNERYPATSGTHQTIPASPERPSSRASSHASTSNGKLRYRAYDAPKAIPRLRPHHTESAARSDSGSSRFIGQGSDIDDPLSRTITAGDLTIASSQMELRNLSKQSPKTKASLSQAVLAVQSLNLNQDEPAVAADLIALDSPFIDPSGASQTSSIVEPDFETTWNKLQHANLRGWCDSPIDVVIRRLHAMQRTMRVMPADQLPFKGDLKILIPSESPAVVDNDDLALLRLREGEEESCLWHLRCEDGNLRASIRTLLTDA